MPKPPETEQTRKGLRALIKDVDVGVTIAKKKQPESIGSSTGAGRRKPKGGDGNAAPYTEDHYTTREYHTNTSVWYSSDGLFTIQASPVKTVHMTDADGAEALFNYADPDAPLPP